MLPHVLLIVSLLAGTYGYNILCLLPYPGKSHHMVFEPLLQELTNRGHNLTVVSFFPSAPQPNRRDVSLVALAPVSLEVVDISDLQFSFYGLEKYFEHIPLELDLARSNLKLCEKILDAPMFQEFVNREGDYDLVIAEHFNSDCMLGIIHHYNLPSVGLSSCVVLPWTPSRVGAPDNPSYVPSMEIALTDKMSFIERVWNTLELCFMKIYFEFAIWSAEQELLERKLGKKLPRLSDVGRNVSALLVNSHHSWNGVKAFPPAVVEVGGIHLHNKTVKPLPAELENWLSDAEDGFIIFSFGSLVRGSTLPVQRIREFVKVFSRLPQKVIWKWESKHMDGLPPNVRITRWLPQFDLLHHPKCVAFITHAGMLSLTEAISARIPVLAVPILGDQFANALHAKEAGFAETIRLGELNEDTLFEVLQKVLSKEARARAKAFSEIWHDRLTPPMDTAVYHIEKAVRHRVEVSTRARWMPSYQLVLLDVIAFLALVSVCIILVLYYSLRLLLRGFVSKTKLKLS